MCFGVSTEVKPVSVKLGWQFVYPVCAFSVADFVTWKGPGFGTASDLVKRFEDVAGDACTAEVYGSNYGNDTPWLSWTLLKYLEQVYEYVPFACDIEFNAPPPQQPFCNLKTDPQCILGCKPHPEDPDCQPNSNYEL